MTRTSLPWTIFEDAALRRFKADHVANLKIAEHLGRTERAVASRVTSLGVGEEREWTLAEDMLFEQGLNNTNIAERAGRTKSAVKNRRSVLRARHKSVLGDEAYISALMALGGFKWLSEKPAREGPRVCLPLLKVAA